MLPPAAATSLAHRGASTGRFGDETTPVDTHLIAAGFRGVRAQRLFPKIELDPAMHQTIDDRRRRHGVFEDLDPL